MKTAAVVLNKGEITINGLTMQAVVGLPHHIVITGRVEKKISLVSQYDSQVISPQEYILQAMYGVFDNEPVVALENRKFGTKTN